MSGSMPVRVGRLRDGLASAMAERAIAVASDFSKSSKAKFMLGSMLQAARSWAARTT